MIVTLSLPRANSRFGKCIIYYITVSRIVSAVNFVARRGSLVASVPRNDVRTRGPSQRGILGFSSAQLVYPSLDAHFARYYCGK